MRASPWRAVSRHPTAAGSASGASISWRPRMPRARCRRACWRAAKATCCRPPPRPGCFRSETSDSGWQRIWGINFMAHVYAARAVLPGMLARGEGYLLQTASAAGLLTQVGSAPYAVTKHAAVSLAEWLSVTYGDRGIRVSCLCPQGVRTNMLAEAEQGPGRFLLEGALEPEQVAEAVVAGLADERFLILPHPEVGEYLRRKANDYDRWLRGMRRMQAKVDAK